MLNVYVNASTASRQPAFQDIYDPQDFYSNPDYRVVNFIPSANGYEYIGKELKPEKLLDFELGADFNYSVSNAAFKGEINLYRMQVKDEIVPYAGQLDDMNVPISGNADKTLHQGIEITIGSKFNNEFSLNGNISFNENRFEAYSEFDWENNEINLSDYAIGGFPSVLANYRIGYDLGKMQIGISGRYVGKQYIDNREQFELDAYHVLDGDISYSLAGIAGIKSLKATLRMMNIANTKYEQSAYIEPDDFLPRYIVGAERNIFVSLLTEF
jgi:iron complex outermembrane recepter protein